MMSGWDGAPGLIFQTISRLNIHIKDFLVPPHSSNVFLIEVRDSGHQLGGLWSRNNNSIKVLLNSDQSQLTPFFQMTSQNLSNKLLQRFPPIRTFANCTRPWPGRPVLALVSCLTIVTNQPTCQLRIWLGLLLTPQEKCQCNTYRQALTLIPGKWIVSLCFGLY